MAKFYIAYAAFLVVLIAAVASYQRHLLNQYRPSLQMLERPVDISGVLQGEVHRKGGVVPMLAGHELACGISFIGVSTRCRELLRNIEIGKPLTVYAVLLPTVTGRVWVALSIQLHDGSTYSTTPESIVAEWNIESRDFLVKTPFIILLFFVGVPILLRLIF